MKKKVDLKNVYKAFDMFEKRSQKILNLLSLKKGGMKQFMALKDVSFEVFEGETVGIIGLNGSGKSTVSNILGGVLQPSDGEVMINGKSSLIAIAAGLNNNLSGLDNIELKCIMHGLTKEQVKELTPSIIEFADIGDYIYQPVKGYSSGMKSRLGFAISVHTDPDILIIDEALSVGDSTFTQKCLNKMKEFQKEGKTIFFISHSAGQMRTFCDRIIWMHYGEVKEIGGSQEIVDHYMEFTKWFNALSAEDKKKHKKEMLNQQVRRTVKQEKSSNNSSKFEIIKNILVFLPIVIMTWLMLL